MSSYVWDNTPQEIEQIDDLKILNKELAEQHNYLKQMLNMERVNFNELNRKYFESRHKIVSMQTLFKKFIVTFNQFVEGVMECDILKTFDDYETKMPRISNVCVKVAHNDNAKLHTILEKSEETNSAGT